MDRTTIEELLLTVITSFKFWLTLYGSFLLFSDTIFFTWFPISLLGTIVISALLYKFKIPPAHQENVNGFFGQTFRPSLDFNLDGNPSVPVEEQPGFTVRSRLQLMKSVPQMTSTPSGSSNSNGRLNNEAPLIVIGHRGAGLDAPENSLSAIRECHRRGCEAIEFDVSLTKDLIPVLFHDENLLRITGIDRDIADMTWEELKKVDISVLHPLGERYRKERVPTFEEAINLCMSIGMKFIIDLKDDDETVVNAVVEAFRRHQMYSLGIVSSFHMRVIYDIRRRDPRIIGCMAWRPGYHRYRTWYANWKNLEPRYKAVYQDWGAIVLDALNDWGIRNLYWWFFGLSCILYHKDAITKELSYRWMKKGIRVYVWTVNSPLEKLQFVQNVQLGYLTDTLDGGEVNTVNSLQSSPILNPSPIQRSNQ